MKSKNAIAAMILSLLFCGCEPSVVVNKNGQSKVFAFIVTNETNVETFWFTNAPLTPSQRSNVFWFFETMEDRYKAHLKENELRNRE